MRTLGIEAVSETGAGLTGEGTMAAGSPALLGQTVIVIGGTY
jgi:hypothetical protein